ncbi:DltD N-terminal domain protein [Apiospora marii]|uniref:DltD N-terminal domain protein n=1 Tax=Apiospora marii TaxID=335849 RepID=A0ABR1RC64_9PEZI
MANKEDVEFKTMDGLTLRGWLFPAAQRGPAIIMTPGFNMIKDMVILEAGQYLHAEGFTVLGYDPRCVGESDGLPRNDIQPLKNVEDYHDALTYLKVERRDIVDPARIAYWGYSFSATVALCAAALDKRARAVVAVSSLTTWEFSKWRQVLAKAMKDRESQLAGNWGVYLPMLTDAGEQPAGFGPDAGYNKENVLDIISRHASIAPSLVTRTTLQTYYNMAAFRPLALMQFVNPTPVLIMTGELDEISPPEMQRSLIYDVFQGPKEFIAIPDRAHMDVITGDGSIEVFHAQAAFLRRAMGIPEFAIA